MLRERALSNGFFEVDLVTKSGQQYRAIMSEIIVPTSPICKYLIEHLPKIGDLEEYEVLEMAHAIMQNDKKSFTVNAIVQSIPYLVRIGLIEYQKKPTASHGTRYFFRRVGTTDQISKLLSSPPSPPSLSSQEGEGESSSNTKTPEVDDLPKPKKKKDGKSKGPPPKLGTDKKRMKQRRKNRDAILGASEDSVKPKKKKKRKKCCDDPHPVKSKKTGKRRCKNCGAKLGKKKKV